MRLVSCIDPHGVHNVHVDGRLRPTMDKMISQHEYRVMTDIRQPDAEFMVAALHFLLREIEALQKVMELAIILDDRKTSAINLKRLIQDKAQKASRSTAIEKVRPSN